MTFDASILIRGDCLLYRPSDVIGWAIAEKISATLCHVEIYVGNGQSFASRDGTGVNIYPTRASQLGYVRRPVGALNLDKANAWVKTVCGEGYDTLDLLTFFMFGKPEGSSNKMICSEAATLFYRNADWQVVNPDISAEAIDPADLWKTPPPALQTVWSDGEI